jgi:ElaB/YqjD/DUF883 family membrane-anchored ribosome-binding protein
MKWGRQARLPLPSYAPQKPQTTEGKDPISFPPQTGNGFGMPRKNGIKEPVDIEHFVQDLKTVVKDGEDLLRASVGVARERALAGAKSTDKLARQFPYQTLGIAFGMGLLIGVLSSTMFRGGGDADEEFEEENYN